MNRGIYKNLDGSIGIIIPTDEALEIFGIKAILEKDVPHNLPYWIVNESDIPTDRTFRNAWEIDESFGEPDGFGGENNEFDEELLRAYHGELNDSNK